MNANGIHDNTLVPDDTDTDHDEHEEEKDAEKGTDERDAMGEELAKKGHNAIVGLRIGLSVALLSATVAAAVFIFWLTRHQEKEAFQKAFSDNSLKMVEAFQVTAERRLTAVASFGTTVTSYALATNATWPFVTIPQMEARASHVLGLADAVAIAFGPLVHQKDREVWENDYVPSNVGWLEESFEYYEDVLQANTEVTSASDSAATTEGAGLSRSRPGTYEGIPDFSAGYSKQISTIGFTPLGTLGPLIAQGDVLLPWWQRAPSPRNEGGGFINVNLLDDPSFDGDLLEVLQRRRAALGRMSFSGYGNSSYTDGSPVSGFYYPILAGPDPTDSANELVGTLATLVFWNTFFANVLPQNAVGMIAVLSSTCNQTFTFRVDGPSVSSLGQGDLHDPQYDDHRLDVSFTASINKRYTDRQYRGFPVDEEGCQYTLSIYASQELEDTYISNMPIYYTCGAVLISLLTSGLFILYDRLVTNRQRAILRQAEQTGAIVSSLFPAAYRERLIQAQQGRKDAKANSAQKGIEAFTANNDIRAPLSSDEPIADLYENCTVLFADIAGFTAWSSTHDPGQVFTLLQTLYAAFDSTAKKRKVFKVETIGDCYLAVTGIPYAQPDHAIIMSKFANEIMLKTQNITVSLVDKLGEETRDLSLRIGLHSGSVTAGILKGDKSRFQLFGDTVNTASRMESTGEKNRIQLSPTTAELLHAAGKGHWLQAREGVTVPKGKDAMQTYWLLPTFMHSVAESVVSSSALSKSDSSPVRLDAMRTLLTEQLRSAEYEDVLGMKV